MIYFHEVRNVLPGTGYGRAFHDLHLALMNYRPRMFCTHPYAGIGAGTGHNDFDIEVFFGPPRDIYKAAFENGHAPVRGVFTMFESLVVPDDFVANIREHFDFIIVPSRWCYDLFTKVFPNHPVFIVPLGVDCDSFPVLDRDFSGTFVFLWQGYALRDRKRADIVVRAFDLCEFDDAHLVIKYTPNGNLGKQHFQSTQGNKTMIAEHYSHAEMLSLWQQCHAGIMPSEAEGIGLMPLEWMATGMPAAFSCNTGAADYADRTVNFPLKCREIEQTFFNDGASGSVPTVETVVEFMRYAYLHREKVAAMGRRAATWVREHWNYERSAVRYIEVIKQVKETLCSKTRSWAK